MSLKSIVLSACVTFACIGTAAAAIAMEPPVSPAEGPVSSSGPDGIEPQPASGPSPGVSSPPTAADAPAPTKADAQVCRRVEQLGSRIRYHRICRTAAEWEALDDRARSQVNRLQRRLGNVVDTAGG